MSSRRAARSQAAFVPDPVLFHTEDLSTVHDVLIIGAGMAGLSAAHHLLDTNLDVLVIEARDRLGGRVWTDRRFAGFPVEFGAEFVRGERAATWAWVNRLRLPTTRWKKTDDSFVRMADGRLLSMTEARAGDPAFDQTRGWDLPDEPARPLEDFESYLRRIGFDQVQLDHVRRAFANAAGDAMRHLDAASMLESLTASELDGDGDYRILAGYDAIVEALGIGVEFATDRVVEDVVWGPEGVKLTTAAGHVFRGRTAIVTLPLGVLQAGNVRFDPPLPPAKIAHLSGLRMGPVVKLIYRFDRPIPPEPIAALYAAGNPPMWWSPSFGRDTDVTVWTAFVTGEGAAALMRDGAQVALARGLEVLRAELGAEIPDPVDARVIDWPTDPFTLGGYSHVLPGHRGAREGLAEATPPLYWAGEATSPEPRACTVHGALLTGLRAADEVRTALAEVHGARQQG